MPPESSSIELFMVAGDFADFNSGLIPIQFQYRSMTAAEQPFILRVAIEEGGITREPIELQRKAVAEAKNDWIGLTSHMLKNGSHVLQAQAIDVDGKVIGEAKNTITFTNSGHVAEALKQQFIEKGASLFFDAPVDSSYFPVLDANLSPWGDQSDREVVFEQKTIDGSIPADLIGSVRHFIDQGYAVLPERISVDLIDRVKADLDLALASGARVIDDGAAIRIVSMDRDFASAAELMRVPIVLRFLESLWGVPARACQSLTFPFGSQQHPHQDSIHLTAMPSGYMCGVWIALEDVQAGSGELVVYPGSHRLPRLTMASLNCAKLTDGEWMEFGTKVIPAWQALVKNAGIEPEPYIARKGDILVWHDALMHGGLPREDMSLTRKSFVIHYFADGAAAYYDSSGYLASLPKPCLSPA